MYLFSLADSKFLFRIFSFHQFSQDVPRSVSCCYLSHWGEIFAITSSNNFSYPFSFSSSEIPITTTLIGKSNNKATSGSVSTGYFSLTMAHNVMFLLANLYYVLDTMEMQDSVIFL